MEGHGSWVDGPRGRGAWLTRLPYRGGSWFCGVLPSAPGSLGLGMCVGDLDSLIGHYFGCGSAADEPAVS